jgi:hypothetical protein
MQRCESGSVSRLDPSSMTLSDPDWEYGSRIRIQGARKQRKMSTGTFLVDFIFFITEMYKNSTNC